MPQTRTENHPRWESELVVACEAGTLLIRSTRKIIQYPPQRFCRVSYSGFTAGTRKPRDRRNVTHAQAIPLLHKEAPKSGVRNEQKSSVYVRCATDRQNWHVILLQKGEINGSPWLSPVGINTESPILFQRLQQV